MSEEQTDNGVVRQICVCYHWTVYLSDTLTDRQQQVSSRYFVLSLGSACAAVNYLNN